MHSIESHTFLLMTWDLNHLAKKPIIQLFCSQNIILLEILMISKGLLHQYPTLFKIYLCVGLKIKTSITFL
jgi:hypothetical protein